MLKEWLQRLRYDEPEQPPAEPLSMALLLVELARADLDFGQAEREAIVDSLAQRYALTQQAAAQLVREAREQAHEIVSLYDYVKSLNASLDAAGKRWLMEALWRVAYADGRIDKYEEHLLRRLAELLYISEEDYVRAKLRVSGDLQ